VPVAAPDELDARALDEIAHRVVLRDRLELDVRLRRAAALRTAVLLGETGRERQDCLVVLRRLCEGVARPEAADLVRRALVVTVTRGEREKLVAELDESLLGVRPTPSSRVTQALAS
jgi:hypothetical protein